MWSSHGSTASPSNRPTMIDFHVTEHSLLKFDPGQAGGRLPSCRGLSCVSDRMSPVGYKQKYNMTPSYTRFTPDSGPGGSKPSPSMLMPISGLSLPSKGSATFWATARTLWHLSPSPDRKSVRSQRETSLKLHLFAPPIFFADPEREGYDTKSPESSQTPLRRRNAQPTPVATN